MDQRLLAFIRRANLDAFWSRRPGTVNGLVASFKEQLTVGNNFGFEMFSPMGPFAPSYDSGMRQAIGILWKSQQKGRHETFMKYSSVRKVRALHTNMFRASAHGIESTHVWRSEKARFVATLSPTDSEWFDRFMSGYQARVGERRTQDTAISISIMLELQRRLEEDWQGLVDANASTTVRRTLAEEAVFYLCCYCASLRGWEAPKIVLHDLRHQLYLNDSPPYPDLLPESDEWVPHVALPLTGLFKARRGIQNILTFVAATTDSGLRPGQWIQRLIDLLDDLGIRTGWLFQDENGDPMAMGDFEARFYDRLLAIQEDCPHLFVEGLDILGNYGLARSFRKGATSRAKAVGVPKDDIDYINRWNTGGDEGGNAPMDVLYAERRLLASLFIRFSKAL